MDRPPVVWALVSKAPARLGRVLRRARWRYLPDAGVEGPAEGPAEGAVRLVEARWKDRPALRNLMQLYRHDLSEFRDYELSEQGTFAYEYLDRFLGEPGREAWIVRVEERLAGFVLTRLRDDGVWQIAELFVARPHRRHGTGRTVLRLAFRLHPGRWACFVDELNETSRRMCMDVAADTSGGDFRAEPGVSHTGFAGTVFELDVG